MYILVWYLWKKNGLVWFAGKKISAKMTDSRRMLTTLNKKVNKDNPLWSTCTPLTFLLQNEDQGQLKILKPYLKNCQQKKEENY